MWQKSVIKEKYSQLYQRFWRNISHMLTLSLKLCQNQFFIKIQVKNQNKKVIEGWLTFVKPSIIFLFLLTT